MLVMAGYESIDIPTSPPPPRQKNLLPIKITARENSIELNPLCSKQNKWTINFGRSLKKNLNKVVLKANTTGWSGTNQIYRERLRQHLSGPHFKVLPSPSLS